MLPKGQEKLSTQGLNSQQAMAVDFDHGNGPLLVLAGAGTGKTTVLTRRIVNLYLESQGASGILALTFTKDAALEMKNRVQTILENRPATKTELWIGTFHAFALSIVRSTNLGISAWHQLGFKKPPQLLDANVKSAWLTQFRNDYYPHISLSRILSWLNSPFGQEYAEKNQDDKWNLLKKEIRNRYREHLFTTGQIDFDDMVTLALRLFQANFEVLKQYQKRFDFVLVDEFQDTSPEQLAFVKILMGANEKLFLVGDDDQAIYGFRGADSNNISSALVDFPRLQLLKLETNYRSTQAIVDYANQVFSDKPKWLRKSLTAGGNFANQCQSMVSTEKSVHKVKHANGIEQLNWMIKEIRFLQDSSGVLWSDIAILYRINALENYYRSFLLKEFGPEALEKVTLSTVHGAKGLEFPVVFFVGLEDGILPYHRKDEKLSQKNYAEEKRIFYVGVTRAQWFLYLCSTKKRILHGRSVEAAPCPFLSKGDGKCGLRFLKYLNLWWRSFSVLLFEELWAVKTKSRP